MLKPTSRAAAMTAVLHTGGLVLLLVPLLVLLLGIAGCGSGPRMPVAPNLYVQAEPDAFAGVPEPFRSPEVDLLYATDRERNETSDEPEDRYYDERRSHSLVVGRAVVRIGDDLGWDELVRLSTTPEDRRIPLEIERVDEQFRFPSSVTLPVRSDEGDLVENPVFIAERAAAADAVSRELSRRLAMVDRKELFIYVHGVGNSFSDPLYRMAQFWHLLGRPGVPAVYTWPAIKGGDPLRGYTYARESSEFTVYHLRQFLEAAASCPDLERIHILAHSRGTGVVLSVLRDLRLIHYHDPAAGRSAFKLGHVVLAAPDIDIEVARQRARPDPVYQILDRLTLYTTRGDRALGVARVLFRNSRRVGSITSRDLDEEQRQGLLENRLGMDLIQVDVDDRGSAGHTYWIDNPSVFSDIILLMRDDLGPGPEHGRPLLRAPSGAWLLRDGYPYRGPHAREARSAEQHGDG